MAFLPAVLLWGVGLLSYKIKDTRLIIFARYFLYASAIAGIALIGGRLQTEMFGEYNVESIAYKSFVTRDYLYRISNEQDGSGYTLGDFDPTLLGMLEQAPAGINVTLFRPYLWEARKPIVMISAIESLLYLMFTIVAIVRNNPIRMIQRIFADETLQFCLIFTLIFAFAVGISTSNFGSLVRYKIPCLPFYTAFLIILFYPPHWNFDFIYKQWELSSEQEDLLKMNIGIMPSKQGPWFEGKCGFKLIQYHACGIPAIASPTRVNSLITLHNKTGFIAKDKDEWKTYLKQLIADAQLRTAMGRAAREHIENNYSLNSLFPAFISLFS